MRDGGGHNEYIHSFNHVFIPSSPHSLSTVPHSRRHKKGNDALSVNDASAHNLTSAQSCRVLRTRGSRRWSEEKITTFYMLILRRK